MGQVRGNDGAPEPCAANPGVGTVAEIAYATEDRTRSENVDLVTLAAAAFDKEGYETINQLTWVEHPASGFAILPQFVSLRPREAGGVNTVTTMQVNHPRLLPQGLFEFQHGWGENAADSIANGFRKWVEMDFATLLDALRADPQVCLPLMLEIADATRKRRALLGPIVHYMKHPDADVPTEEHSFCHCCLLTKSYEALRPLIEGDELFGLRLFVARDAEGKVAADCRINGEDFQPGAEALAEYAQSWPPRGYEFRKQYVILQTVEE